MHPTNLAGDGSSSRLTAVARLAALKVSFYRDLTLDRREDAGQLSPGSQRLAEDRPAKARRTTHEGASRGQGIAAAPEMRQAEKPSAFPAMASLMRLELRATLRERESAGGSVLGQE